MRDFNESYTIRDFVDKNKWSNVYIGINNETKQNIILNMLINIDGNEGKIETITNMIKNMLKLNQDEEFIMKCTNAKKEDIEKVKKELKMQVN